MLSDNFICISHESDLVKFLYPVYSLRETCNLAFNMTAIFSVVIISFSFFFFFFQKGQLPPGTAPVEDEEFRKEADQPGIEDEEESLENMIHL